MNWRFVAITAVFIYGVPAAVLAAAVTVKPQQVDIVFNVNQKGSAELLVVNSDDAPALFTITSTNSISIEPHSFQMNPYESKKIVVFIESILPKTKNTEISVVSHPLKAGGISAAAGIKVPLTFTAYGIHWSFPLFGAVILSAVAFFLSKSHVKKSYVKNSPKDYS